MSETRGDTPNRAAQIDNGDTLESGRSTSAASDTGNPGGDPLTKLKSIVLSLDWEITDEVMRGFFQEIQRLEDRYSNERILVSFLHLLESIGKYIRIHKGKAHPHAAKLLNSTYMSLEKVIRSRHLTAVERKRMLAREFKSYRRLKEQITFRKTAKASEKRGEEADKTRPMIEQQGAAPLIEKVSRVAPGKTHERSQGPVDTIETFPNALEELKQFIHEEFKALREELKEWRKT